MNTIEELAGLIGKRLDPDQMRAVTTLGGNLVVSAGAGSGKTTVLSFRYLNLLLHGVHADEILALTFTEKATLEMQSRIGALVKRFSTDTRLDEETRRLFLTEWNDHFPKASISTLDGFSSKILRSDPYRYGLTADYVPEAEWGGQNEQEARLLARSMLSAVATDAGARLFASRYKPQAAVDLLVTLALRSFHLPHRIPQDLTLQVKTAVEGMRDDARRQMDQASSQIVKIAEEGAAVGKTASDVISLMQDLEKKREASGDDAAWEQILRQVSWPRKPSGKGANQEIGEAYTEFRTACAQFLTAGEGLQHQADLEMMVDFLSRYEEAFQRTKRSTGVLTFRDVAALAIELLTTQPALRRSYVHRFKAIMIDEFQDDNEQQKQLLYLLSAKDSFDGVGIPSAADILDDRLFFVGDEKQSIYQFRGADVAVFKRLSEELGSGPATQLSTNYRTEPGLIDLFSTLFSQVMRPSENLYEAAFSSLKGRAPTPGVQGSLTVMIKPEDSGEKNDDEEAQNADCEAYAVAERIHQMLTTDLALIPDGNGGVRRPLPHDIALLLRTGTHQMSFERAFKAWNIPYTMSKVSRSLMLEAPSNDMYALLQCLVYPEDRIAFLSVLRSPFCPLSDHEVFQVMDDPKMAFDATVLPDNPGYQECCRRYQKTKEFMRSATLPALIQHLWFDLGYRSYYLEHPGYHAYLDHYDYLYRLAEQAQANGESLATFLDDLRPFLGTSDAMNTDGSEVLTEGKEGVQIMTVHGAKGLEFPIVFVSCFSDGANRKEGDYFTVGSECVPYYDAIPERYEGVGTLFRDKEQEEAERTAETKRILYVAMTRAEYHLVCSGFHGNRAQKGNTLEWLEAGYGITYDEQAKAYRCATSGVNVQVISPVTPQQLFVDRNVAPLRPEIAAFYQGSHPDLVPARQYVAATQFAPEAPHTASAVPFPPLASDSVLQDALERHPDAITLWGTFVHNLVEARMRDPSAPALPLLPPGLAELDEKSWNLLVSDGERLCGAFLAQPWYLSEVAPYPVETEVRFFSHETMDGEAVVVEGAVDVLVHRPDHLLVLDFKTDRLDDAVVHAGQLGLYRRAMERVYHQKVRTAIVYLRDSASPRWIEGEAE